MQMRGFEGLFTSLGGGCQAARNCPLKGDADAGMSG